MDTVTEVRDRLTALVREAAAAGVMIETVHYRDGNPVTAVTLHPDTMLTGDCPPLVVNIDPDRHPHERT